jgi:hypothetical protein
MEGGHPDGKPHGPTTASPRQEANNRGAPKGGHAPPSKIRFSQVGSGSKLHFLLAIRLGLMRARAGCPGTLVAQMLARFWMATSFVDGILALVTDPCQVGSDLAIGRAPVCGSMGAINPEQCHSEADNIL